MIRRPPRSTRTDTFFPYTTLFRADPVRLLHEIRRGQERLATIADVTPQTAPPINDALDQFLTGLRIARTEEHTSELQSLMRISYAVFCIKKHKRSHANTKVTSLTTTHQLGFHRLILKQNRHK